MNYEQDDEQTDHVQEHERENWAAVERENERNEEYENYEEVIQHEIHDNKIK